jgi:ribosomal protein S16
MAKFSSDNQPGVKKGRGTSERTKILQALKRQGKKEEDFYDLLITRALDPEDTFALREVLARFSPLKKATLPDVEFEFNKSGTPTQQVTQILDAISSGIIPPDVGSQIISAVRNAVEIEINTEIKARIEAIEEALKA